MLLKTEAIVLRTVKYGDSQLIIDMLTQQLGCVTFIQKLSNSKTALIRKSLFQPLTLLNIEFNYRQSVQLQRLKEACVAYPFQHIPFDTHKLAVALFTAEFVYHCVKHELTDEKLFRFVNQSILLLDTTPASCSNFHLVFMVRFTEYIGFAPNIQDYHSGDFFDLRNGVFCAVPPTHADYVRPHEASFIQFLCRMRYETMSFFRFSRLERNRCVHLMLTYYKLHVPSFPELKSLNVLETLFQ